MTSIEKSEFSVFLFFFPLLTWNLHLFVFKNIPPSLCPSGPCCALRFFMHNLERQSKRPSPTATLTSLNNRSGCMRRHYVRLLVLPLLLLTVCFIHEAYFGPENWASWIRGDSLRLSTAPSRGKPVAAAAVSNRWMRSQPPTELPLQSERAASNASLLLAQTHTPLFFFLSICAQGGGGGAAGGAGGRGGQGRFGVMAPLPLFREATEVRRARGANPHSRCDLCVSRWETGRKGQGGRDWRQPACRRSVPCCLKSQSLDASSTFSCYIFVIFLFFLYCFRFFFLFFSISANPHPHQFVSLFVFQPPSDFFFSIQVSITGLGLTWIGGFLDICCKDEQKLAVILFHPKKLQKSRIFFYSSHGERERVGCRHVLFTHLFFFLWRHQIHLEKSFRYFILCVCNR